MPNWTPKSVGLLAQHKDLKSLDGQKVLFYEEPYDSADGRFTNVKIQFPDGSKFLASISDRSGEFLSATWGFVMETWKGRFATISVHESRTSDKLYYLFHPTDETDDTLISKPLTEEEKNQIKKIKEKAQTDQKAIDSINPADIPF